MTWLDKEKLLEIAQNDGEVTLTSDQVELLFEENAKLVKALEEIVESEKIGNSFISETGAIAQQALSELRGGTQ